MSCLRQDLLPFVNCARGCALTRCLTFFRLDKLLIVTIHHSEMCNHSEDTSREGSRLVMSGAGCRIEEPCPVGSSEAGSHHDPQSR
jgi:hypothetical protein